MHAITAIMGRVVFALPFTIFGFLRVVNPESVVPAGASPAALFLVFATGAALIAGSLAIMTDLLGRWAALGISLLMLLFSLLVDVPGLDNPSVQQLALTNLLKHLGLSGGALIGVGLLGG